MPPPQLIFVTMNAYLSKYLVLVLLSLSACSFEQEVSVVEQENLQLSYDLYIKAKANIDDPQTARYLVNQSIKASSELNDKTYLIYGLNLRGYLSLEEGKYIEAIEDFEASLTHNTFIAEQKAYSLFFLGRAHVHLDQFKIASDFLRKATLSYRDLDSQKWLQRSKYYLAMSEFYAGEATAEELANEAYTLAEQVESEQAIKNTAALYVEILLSKNKVGEAEALIKNLETRYSTFDNASRLRLFNRKAIVLVASHKFMEAEAVYKEALLLIEATYPAIEARVFFKTYYDYGQLLLSTGDPKEAIAIWESSLALAGVDYASYQTGLLNIYKGIAKAARQTGDSEKAIIYLEKATELSAPQLLLQQEIQKNWSQSEYLISQKNTALQEAADRINALESSIARQERTVTLWICSMVLVTFGLLIGVSTRAKWLRKRMDRKEQEVQDQILINEDLITEKQSAFDALETDYEVLNEEYEQLAVSAYHMQQLIEEIGGDGIEALSPEQSQKLKQLIKERGLK